MVPHVLIPRDLQVPAANVLGANPFGSPRAAVSTRRVSLSLSNTLILPGVRKIAMKSRALQHGVIVPPRLAPRVSHHAARIMHSHLASPPHTHISLLAPAPRVSLLQLASRTAHLASRTPHPAFRTPHSAPRTPHPAPRSKAIEIYYWVAACPPKEIDAFLFSGPEEFFYGAPLISPLADRIDFSMQNRWIWIDPPLEVVQTDRNLLLGCSMST